MNKFFFFFFINKSDEQGCRPKTRFSLLQKPDNELRNKFNSNHAVLMKKVQDVLDYITPDWRQN